MFEMVEGWASDEWEQTEVALCWRVRSARSRLPEWSETLEHMICVCPRLFHLYRPTDQSQCSTLLELLQTILSCLGRDALHLQLPVVLSLVGCVTPESDHTFDSGT